MYEIPKNLTKYSEEFLWGLNLRQFVYALLTIVTCFVILKIPGIPENWIRGVLMVPVVLLGIFFVFLKLDEKIADNRNLNNSLKNSSYFDKKIESFVDVQEITDNVVVLKDGTMISILEVKPLDFFILSEEQKKSTLSLYEEWLKSIDYPIQIISRSVNVNLNNWLGNLQKLEPVKKDFNHYKSFKKWISDEIEKNSVRNRLFYLLIPIKTRGITKQPILQELKSLITGKYATSINKESEEYRTSLAKLNNSLASCREMLEPCGVTTRRIKTTELLGLYTSYFTNTSNISAELLTPIMWLDKSSTLKQDELLKRLKNAE